MRILGPPVMSGVLGAVPAAARAFALGIAFAMLGACGGGGGGGGAATPSTAAADAGASTGAVAGPATGTTPDAAAPAAGIGASSASTSGEAASGNAANDTSAVDTSAGSTAGAASDTASAIVPGAATAADGAPTASSSAGNVTSGTAAPVSSAGAGESTSAAPAPTSNGPLAITSVATPAPTPVVLPAPPRPVVRVVTDTRRVVPASMIGLHSYTYPVALRPYFGYQAGPPTFPYALRRSINYDGVFWYDIHNGRDPDKWDWAGLDRVIDDAHARGIAFLYTFLYTPAHLRWPGLENTASPAPNWRGSTTMPNDLAQVEAFVTALVRRYNTGGVRKLQYIETWNEPTIDGNITAPVHGTAYWVGSTLDNSDTGKARRLADLALLHKTIAQAARAADPGIRIVAPGWSPAPAAQDARNWVRWFRTADATGATPLQFTDVFACHPYTSGVDAQHILGIVGSYDDARKAVDPERPLFGTEAGNEATGLSSTDHATVIKRKLLLAAARGYDNVALYAYEDERYLGNPWKNPDVSAAISDFAAAVIGRTIVTVVILDDGSVWAVFSDGTTFRA